MPDIIATAAPAPEQSTRHGPALDMRRSAWRRLEAFAERMFILWALYVLSIGPMYWQWVNAKYVDGPVLLAAFYEPLWIVSSACPPLGEWINWYVRLWIL